MNLETTSVLERSVTWAFQNHRRRTGELKIQANAESSFPPTIFEVANLELAIEGVPVILGSCIPTPASHYQRHLLASRLLRDAAIMIELTRLVSEIYRSRDSKRRGYWNLNDGVDYEMIDCPADGD